MKTLLWTFLWLGLQSASAVPIGLGNPAPQLIVPTLSGQTLDLKAFRGKPVVVNFWACWCPPCQQELPVIDGVYRKYHSRGLEVIGLSVDSTHDRDLVKKQALNLGYPVAMLADAQTNGFGPPAELPVTYLIDGAGVVRAKFSPADKKAMTEESLSSEILPLLKKEK